MKENFNDGYAKLLLDAARECTGTVIKSEECEHPLCAPVLGLALVVLAIEQQMEKQAANN